MDDHCGRIRLTAVFVVAFLLNDVTVSELPGQQYESSSARDYDSRNPSSPLRRLPAVNKYVIDNRTAYIFWPSELVGEATITAIDLDSFQLKWKHVVGGTDVSVLHQFGNRLFYRTKAEPGPDSVNGRNFATECFVSLETGEAITQSTDRQPYRHIVFGESHLVTGRIYSTKSDDAVTLDEFSRRDAVIDRGKLYETGFQIDENQRITGESTLRRIDLETGTVELTLDLTGIDGHLLAARDDKVIMEVSERVRKRSFIPFDDTPPKQVLQCYDIRQNRLLSKLEVPTWVRAARYRDDGRLECQCESPQRFLPVPYRERVTGDPPERIPVVIDINLGTCVIDDKWRDPYSVVDWYAEGSAIVDALRNDRFLVAILSNNDIVCVDVPTAKLNWRQSLGGWAHFSNVLGEQIITSMEGAVEVTDVATGACHRIRPEMIGLNLAPAMRLPTWIASNDTEELRSAKEDWFYDWLLLAVPALPLLIWAVYRVCRWRFAGAVKKTNSKIAV